MAKTIVGAVLENDPASRNWFNVILNYPGVHAIFFYRINHFGSLTVVSIFSLTKSLKTLIISMLLSFFVVKFVKFNVGICRNV